MNVFDSTNSEFFFDGIDLAKKMLNENFNITFSNVTQNSHNGYKADGDYDVDIYISNHDVIYLTFKDMLSLKDGLLVSSFKHPMIIKYLSDMNGFFYIFDAIRFTTEDKKIFYPIIENLKPSIVFRYSIINKEMTISVQLLNKIKKDNDDTICIITKDTIIQHGYEPADFEHVYGLKSSFYHSDLLLYKERIQNAWSISSDSEFVDYKQMGQLTDMIHI